MSKLTIGDIAVGLREALRIQEGHLPSQADLISAPTLSGWAVEQVGENTYRLIGVVTGHPIVPDGWCTTSVVLVMDPERGWARTVSRLYRLAEPLG